MEFNVNSPILFVLVGVVIAIVMAQSIYFLMKAWKRALKLGIDKGKLKKIVRTAIIFTIAPAVAIVISVIVLAKSLGVPMPWLRLSVIGSLSYETVAATNALSAMGKTLNDTIANASEYVTVLSVMTVSILVGIWLSPIVCKRMQSGMLNIEKRDKKWGEILTNSLFMGMISAFIGFVFCDVLNVTKGDFSGLIPVCVFAVAAIVMMVCGMLMKKLNWKWLNDYALPISLILGMASAIPFTQWLG